MTVRMTVGINSIMDKGIYSVIDANINRALEGIRVCEDIMRFNNRLPEYSVQFKDIRHQIREGAEVFPQEKLLYGRDVDGDNQKFVDIGGETIRESVVDLFRSNIHRAIEAVRCLEEFLKVVHNDGPGDNEKSNPFQKIRFSLYGLEKEIVPLMVKEKALTPINRSLYGILDSTFVKGEYKDVAHEMIQGGARIIQLRMKYELPGAILPVAKKLSEICRAHDAIFIVNDYPDIAYLSNAHGVHIGQDDLPVSEIRKIIPDHMIIGLSTHSVEDVEIAQKSAPDYIAIGPIFDTTSKDGTVLEGNGIEIIKAVKGIADTPLVAIGGINEKNVHDVIKAGADSAAIISSLYKNGSIESNCKIITEIIQSDADTVT